MDAAAKPAQERRHSHDRRRGIDRRDHVLGRITRYPTWQEQKVQFFTRYLFWALGLAFFNFADIAPAWFAVEVINVVFAIYFVFNTAFFFHARRHLLCPARYRLAMWVDVAITSVSVVNDPYSLPPSVLVFIMIVLGNGMRYGMRIFGEALVACFAAVMLVFSLRYMESVQDLSPGLMFLNLFGAIILIYSYILMGRIESSRQQLEQSSRLDTLTGLLNRRALFEISELLFSQAQRHQYPVTVMFLDLDKFKTINDSYGHSVGDQVLGECSAILKHTVRSADVAARFGGDEFVLLLPDTTLDQAELAARRIQERVGTYAQASGYEFSITIGMGEAPRHGNRLERLLQRVDAAMYQGKTNHGSGGIERVADSPTPSGEGFPARAAAD